MLRGSIEVTMRIQWPSARRERDATDPISPIHPIETDSGSSVQLRAAGLGRSYQEGVQALATQGVSSGGGSLPHADRIQASFGHHDLSQVQAYQGGAATAACQGIGADAYATGDKIAFASSPDLHTAAHEAAHTVQQSQGVQLSGGVGKAGDVYERHADAVADAVVEGKSAQGLLDKGPSGGGGSGVQLKPQDPACVLKPEGDDIYGDGELGIGGGTPEASGPVDREALFESRARTVIDEIKAQKNFQKWATGKVKMASWPDWFAELQGILVARTVWTDREERGQLILREYANYRLKKDGHEVPGNLQVFFDYIGRGEHNADAIANRNALANQGKGTAVKSSADLGGHKGAYDWCQASSTEAVLIALRDRGYEPTKSKREWNKEIMKLGEGEPGTVLVGEAAYAAKLNPGDYCSYLYQNCQGGGHAVTVVADLGDSFLNVSGNRAEAVVIEETKRRKTPPKTSDGSDFSLAKANATQGAQLERQRRVAEDQGGLSGTLAKINHALSGPVAHYNKSLKFEGKSLVWSITRMSKVFGALEVIDNLDEDYEADERAAILAKFHLREIESG